MSTNNPASRPAYGHAVVIGGSMAGMLAARVASDHFQKVTVIERDALPDAPEARKGVPQARHLHGLLKKGEDLLAGLFPDLVPGLIAGGALKVNVAKELWWHQFGGWKARGDGRLDNIFVSRPFLENEVRRRVRALPNVTFLEGTEVQGLSLDKARNTVTGVQHRRVGGGADELLAADLVIEASGRGSRMPAWLEAAGRSKVKESTLQVDIGYATRTFKRPPPGKHPWTALFVTGSSPDKRLGVVAPIEGDRWIATVVGVLGDHPPTDEAGWLEFAKGLPAPDLYTAVREAEPLTDIVSYKFSAHLRRHYDQMADLPEGVAVFGDAHCSFNPVYGQGITTTSIGAVLLGDHLQASRAGGATTLPPGFSRKYQKALGKACNEPWTVSTSEDMRYPEVVGTRPPGTAFLHWYTKRFNQVATVDPDISLLFYRTINMLSPAAGLMKPGVFWKVLKGLPSPSPGAQASPSGAGR